MTVLQDEGSLVGVAGHRHATHLVYMGLMAMQHRASAGVGLAMADGSTVRGLHAPGTVDRVLTGRIVDQMDAPMAIGRLTGVPSFGPVDPAPGLGAGGRVDVQEPVVRTWSGGRLAVATAGRLTNGKALRKEVLERGVLAGDSDAELVAALLALEDGRTLVNRVVAVLHRLRGAFSLLVLSEERLIAARDPRGYRPLCIGQLGAATLFASEDAALRDLGCEMVRPVAPGEVLVVDNHGMLGLKPFLSKPRSASLADLVELARDDATVDGIPVTDVRLALGQAIAKERPAPGAGLIVGLPGQELVAAGYAQALGRRFVPALSVRRAARIAHPAPADVDDAVFRAPLRASGVHRADVALIVPVLGTGIEVEHAVQALRAGGARRVHLRVATPGLAHADPFGLALPPPEALAAVRLPLPEVLADGLSVDSAASLSVEGMRAAIDAWEDGWCDVAWSGEIPEAAEVGADQLGLFGADE